MDIKTQIKILLTLKRMSMKELAEELSAVSDKTYTASMIYAKLNRDSISYTECEKIAKILGYEIVFKER